MGEGTATTAIPFEQMEQGRMLITYGRNWLDLTRDDIDRGARAVVRSPQYRAEIARTAIRYAFDIEDDVLAAACSEAWDDLDRWAAKNGSNPS